MVINKKRISLFACLFFLVVACQEKKCKEREQLKGLRFFPNTEEIAFEDISVDSLSKEVMSMLGEISGRDARLASISFNFDRFFKETMKKGGDSASEKFLLKDCWFCYDDSAVIALHVAPMEIDTTNEGFGYFQRVKVNLGVDVYFYSEGFLDESSECRGLLVKDKFVRAVGSVPCCR